MGILGRTIRILIGAILIMVSIGAALWPGIFGPAEITKTSQAFSLNLNSNHAQSFTLERGITYFISQGGVNPTVQCTMLGTNGSIPLQTLPRAYGAGYDYAPDAYQNAYTFELNTSGDYTITCLSETIEKLHVRWEETSRSALDFCIFFGCFFVFLMGLFFIVLGGKKSVPSDQAPLIASVPSYFAKVLQDPDLRNYGHEDSSR